MSNLFHEKPVHEKNYVCQVTSLFLVCKSANPTFLHITQNPSLLILELVVPVVES